MPNRGVTGVVRDVNGAGIPDLLVHAYDVDGLVGEDGEDELGHATTTASGGFAITYAPRQYGGVFDNPDLVLRVFDPYLRLLYESTPPVPDVTVEIHAFPDIVLHPGDIAGWLVTHPLIERGPARGQPVARTDGNELEVMIDNAAAWGQLVTALRGAASSIHMTQLFLGTGDQGVDGRVYARFDDPQPTAGQPARGPSVSEELRNAAERGVPVDLLLNDIVDFDFGGRIDSRGEAEAYFLGTRLVPRFFRTSVVAPMHSKQVIIDGSEAWLLGSPDMQQYFDDPTHRIRDPRRGRYETVYGSTPTGILSPIHDLSVRVRGPAVRDIDAAFRDFQRIGTTAPPIVLAPAPPLLTGPRTASVQVLRTLPGDRADPPRAGETGILEAYQRAFAAARDYIYIEDQYIWSRALLETLKRALQLNTGLQVIIVGNINLDLPGWQGKQECALEDLEQFAHDIGHPERLGIYTLWLHEPPEPPAEKTRIHPLYVHSKVAVVDDRWAAVGSANLDGPSMNEAEVHGLLRYVGYPNLPPGGLPGVPDPLGYGPPVQHASDGRTRQPGRNGEVNVVIYSDVGGQPPTDVIRQMREDLWREHLGIQGVFPARPAQGWLDLWESAVSAKLQGLWQAPTPTLHPSRPLPLMSTASFQGQLERLDVDTKRFEVVTHFEAFDLAAGAWLD
jgi:phosphatidylserine/phosphatidylglycerophosphate/cardiolipin synthase-like enzyme